MGFILKNHCGKGRKIQQWGKIKKGQRVTVPAIGYSFLGLGPKSLPIFQLSSYVYQQQGNIKV